jgi:beta-lactamase regulating signal transducer with metallopeptidase domain/multidrug resistance efflux pump
MSTSLLAELAVKGAIVLVLAWGAALVFRKAGAAVKHLLWLFALSGLLALPLISALLPNWHVPSAWSAVSTTAGEAIRPATSALEVIANSQTGPNVADTALDRLQRGGLVGKSVWQALGSLFSIVWAAGAAALGIRLVTGCWLLERLSRRTIAMNGGKIAEMLESVRERLGVARRIEVKLDSDGRIPLVFGILRPLILLPAEAVEWEEAKLRCVLLHEVAHVKRSDPALQLLAQISCALYWFNPLVWLAARRLHAEAECACDDMVLAAGVRGSDYAEQLLAFAGRVRAQATDWLLSSGLAIAQPSRLEGRLLAVLDETQVRKGPTRMGALSALILGLGVLIPLAMLRAAEGKPADPTAQNHSADEEKPKTVDPTESAPASDDAVLQQDLFRVRLVQAEKDFKRAEALRREKAISQEEYEKVLYEVKMRKAELASAASKPGKDSTVASVESAQADVEVATAEAALARATLKRMSLLADEKAISQSEREHAETGVALAEVRLKLARSQLERATASLGTQTKEDPSLAEANHSQDAEVLEAEVNLAKITVEGSRVRLERIAKLVEEHTVAQEELETAKLEVAKAEAQLKLALVRLEKARKMEGSIKKPGF